MKINLANPATTRHLKALIIFIMKECPNNDGIIELEEDFRLKIYTDKMTRSRAAEKCANERIHGHLVVLDEEWKMDAVSNILTSCSDYKESDDYWTDGNCWFQKCNFTDGKIMPMTEKFWHIGKPDSDTEKCVSVWKNEVYMWNDRNCDTNYPYICQY